MSGLESPSYSTMYYSGLQAVNIWVERQEDVSNLGGTLGGQTSSLARSCESVTLALTTRMPPLGPTRCVVRGSTYGRVRRRTGGPFCKHLCRTVTMRGQSTWPLTRIWNSKRPPPLHNPRRVGHRMGRIKVLALPLCGRSRQERFQ